MPTDLPTLAIDNLDRMDAESQRVCEYAIERILNDDESASQMQAVLRERLRRSHVITSNL